MCTTPAFKYDFFLFGTASGILIAEQYGVCYGYLLAWVTEKDGECRMISIQFFLFFFLNKSEL